MSGLYFNVCDGCGQAYHFDAILPSEVWDLIANGAYALCPLCIDARLASKDLRCACDFHFRGRSLKSNTEISWRPQGMTNPTGHPALYGKAQET